MTTSPPPTDRLLDRATDSEYAAVSILAIAGLVLSLGGLIAVLLPAEVLVAVPAVGMITSLSALVRIARSRGVLTGRRIAWMGIVLGAVLFLLSGTAHVLRWRQQASTLAQLKTDTLAVVQGLETARYEDVAPYLAPAARDILPQIVDDLRRRFTPLWEGAGNVTGQRLLSLQLQAVENGDVAAEARVHVECEHRILEITVGWYQPQSTGTTAWFLHHADGQETFESIRKFGRTQNTSPAPDTGL